MKAQAELFPAELFAAPPVPDQSQKIFRGANGVELPYWEEGGKIIRVALSDQLYLMSRIKKAATYTQKSRDLATADSKKTKISFLSQAAVIRRSLE